MFNDPLYIKNNSNGEKRSFYFNNKEIKLKNEDNFNKILDLTEDIEISQKLNQKAIAQECSEWIKNKVNMKLVKNSGVLHGKLLHMEDEKGNEKALVGSSNFTLKGLGLGKNNYMQLNIEANSKYQAPKLKKWFFEVWNNEELVIDIKEKILTYIQELYKENSPEFIYFLTLYNVFKEFLDDQNNINLSQDFVGFKETKIWDMLYEFQKDGVEGAINKLEKYNGCIIADSVGLGKTFEALAVIRYYELRNYRVLVLCPKKLRNNWLMYKGNDKRNILIDEGFRYDVLNHTDLTR